MKKEKDLQESLKEIIENPIAFMRFVSNLVPFDYQKNFLSLDKKRIIFKAGRQVGKTTITAIKALHRAFSNPEQVILILAPTQRQSSLLFWKIREIVNSNPFLKSKLIRETLTQLIFKNGSQIHCLPSGHTGDTIRGFSADLIIVDEASFVPDEVFIAVEPSLAVKNGDLILISTPFGKRGRFWEAWNSNEWEKISVKSEECPLINKDFLESMRNQMTENEYLQEFEGEFIEEADTFFTRDLVLNCISDVNEKMEGDFFLGVDIARYGIDESVYVICCLDNEKKVHVVKIINTSNQPITDVIGRIKSLHKEYRFNKIFIDETGLGAGAVDILKEENLPIEPITFTLQTKHEMYKNLKLLMEQGRLFFIKNDKLILQLTSLQYEYTAGGYLKIQHPKGGHDDYADALALACLCVKENTEKIVLLEPYL